MNDKIFLSTGELAKMLGVTKQTVIFYDKIGLISPAKRGEKDYRYYTLEQADELDSILTFRNLGVSIETLKEYLSVRNADRCIEMLKQQKQKVDMEIQKLDRIRKKIESRARLLEQVAVVKDFEKVEFGEHPQELFMVEPCREPDEKTFMQSFINLCNRSKQLHIDFENPVCNIIKREDLLAGGFGRTAYFGIKLPEHLCGECIPQCQCDIQPKSDLSKKLKLDKAIEDKVQSQAGKEEQSEEQEQQIESFVKPFGIYASTYHQGPYDTMYLAYERLLEAIEEQGYDVCGNAYEIDLFSTLTSSDRDEYLKHISIQVEKKQPCEKP